MFSRSARLPPRRSPAAPARPIPRPRPARPARRPSRQPRHRPCSPPSSSCGQRKTRTVTDAGNCPRTSQNRRMQSNPEVASAQRNVESQLLTLMFVRTTASTAKFKIKTLCRPRRASHYLYAPHTASASALLLFVAAPSIEFLARWLCQRREEAYLGERRAPPLSSFRRGCFCHRIREQFLVYAWSTTSEAYPKLEGRTATRESSERARA